MIWHFIGMWTAAFFFQIAASLSVGQDVRGWTCRTSYVLGPTVGVTVYNPVRGHL